ncbi:MAG: hypothetical protein MK102_07135 [Fuerstiella sp.]|nr:hypothetical protein [Fuerstiella sp.]
MKPTLFTLTTLIALSGCATSLLEERVISDFVTALEEENVPAMRRVVSDDFERKVRLSDDTFRDLNIVKLPKGELEILDIAEPTDESRSVIVCDDAGNKYKFELILDPGNNRWSVNDVVVRQQKKWKKVRSNVTWPTSQVLDLVFSVREYLDTWSTFERSQILSRSSPAMAASLESVPESWLPLITNGIAANYDPALARKPEAQLNNNAAVVRMPVRGGYLLVSAVLVDNRWLMDDIEIHSRSDAGHPGSVRRQADAVGSLGRFLNAFSSGNTQMLQDSSTQKFYGSTLQFADLKLVSLPSPDLAPKEVSIRAFSGRVTIVVPTESEIVRFDLVDPDRSVDKQIVRTSKPRQFLVDDVILNDRSRRNERTLGSVFTAPARASLFVTAMQARDIQMLKQLSTREFNAAVWDQISPELLSRMTLPSAQLNDIVLEGSSVRGNRTELTYRTSNGVAVRCRMLDQVGRLAVDDFQFPNAQDQILSLRVQSALQIPVAEFTVAWRANDLTALKEACSIRFNRLVLNHFATLPEDTFHLGDRLDTALRSTRVTEERATVHMGLASVDTAEVHLIQEHDRWVIDDISIPDRDRQTVRIRNLLRQQVADNMLTRSAKLRQTDHTLIQDQQQAQQHQIRVARPVQNVHHAGGFMPKQKPVVTAGLEVFGPNSTDIARKLSNPDVSTGFQSGDSNAEHRVDESGAMLPAAGERTSMGRGLVESLDGDAASVDLVDDDSSIIPEMFESVPRLKPVPQVPDGDPVDDGEYLHFGPGIRQSDSIPTESIVDRSPSVISEILDLGRNPVQVDP